MSQSSYCLGHKQLHKEIWDRGYSGSMSAREYIGVDWIGNPKENNKVKEKEREKKKEELTKPQSNLMVSELRRRKTDRDDVP